MREHEKIAEDNPEAYEGTVRLRNQVDVPVVYSANMLDLAPIIRRFRQWAITEFGLECLVVYIPIEKNRLGEVDWVEELKEKKWADLEDFQEAHSAAKDYFAGKA